jgi:4-alpha-glucanotransferase
VILPLTKQAGVCLHLTSLPGQYGIGEIGAAAREFIDAMVAMNLAVWQFLPTGPTAYGDSPYQPLSTFAGNELLLDINAITQLGLLEPHETEPLRRLPHARVDYGALIPLKNALLSQAAARFPAKADDYMRSAFDNFVQANDQRWLHDYALYRVLKTQHGERPWPEWRPEFVRRDAAALRKLEDSERESITRIKVLQFLFAHQWNALHTYASEHGVQMFGDMPIYIALDSADAWAHPELLCITAAGQPEFVAGVPPDYFSEDGQLWGNPLYDWDYHAATGYRWWTERLHHAAALAHMIRIDHFRGFESYWSVPATAATARDGQWEPGPGHAIFDAIRQATGKVPIIAEDLGVITLAVEELRDGQQIPGMRVLQFDVVADDFSLTAIPQNCVCYTGTHDNDTTVGWFSGTTAIDLQSTAEIIAFQTAVLECTGGRPESIHNDMIKLAFASEAKLAIAPLQDYLGLGSEARLNTPGTTGHNWQWRVLPGQLTPDLYLSVNAMTAAAGRGSACNSAGIPVS